MSWLPNWARKMARVFDGNPDMEERKVALQEFQVRRARLTEIVAEAKAWAEVVQTERNLEQLEAIMVRMDELWVESQRLMREAVLR